MIVVSDTSSLFYAAEIGCEDLFHQVFDEVFIPESVQNELLANTNTDFVNRILSKPWLWVQKVEQTPLLSELLLQIDQGESEAIVLAIHLSAYYILIDERRGRAVAKKLQLKTTGLLGFFLLAKEKGIIDKVKPWIDKLTTQTRFRHTKRLIDAVLIKAGEA